MSGGWSGDPRAANKGVGGGGWGGDPRASTSTPSAKNKPSGGFLHELGHLASQTGSDLYNTAVHSPSGLYNLGKDLGETEFNLVVHPGKKSMPIDKDLKAVKQGYEEDAKHPLRHPGNTLLDTLGVASAGAGTAARMAEVGRAFEAGEGVSGVARAAIKGPKPQDRILNYNGKEVQAGQYSRSALRRSTQRLRDQLQERFPDLRLPIRDLHARVGHELGQNRKITEAIEKAPAAALAKVKLNPAEQKALQVVAEGVPIDQRIAFHEEQLSNLEPKQSKLIASTKKEIALLRSARPHVTEIDGVPRINPANHKLVETYQMAHKVASEREKALGGAEVLHRGPDHKVVREQALSDETAAARKVGPAKLMGHTFDPEQVPELFRFPYKREKAAGSVFRPQGFKGGIPLKPGSLKKTEYKLLKSGAFRNDTTRLVAESHLEAHRFAAVMKHRDEFLQLAHDERESPDDVPVRTDQLLHRAWPKVIQDISEKPELSKDDVAALDNHFEDLRSTLFPSVEEVERELARGEHPDVKWINKRVLGGLNEPNPTVAPSVRRAVSVFDNINNASRAAILYLKPAYAVPNILGNAALNLVQQGWAAPAQIARSVRLWHTLDKGTLSKVKLAMGEGISGSLESEHGIGTAAINKMAHLWQKPVDTPFRVNAFFYEARRAGYKTPAQIKALFTDEKKLLPIAREANAAIIDYGNLNQFEQSVIRRVIFFYPWVKGSTRYAGRYLSTHGAQASFVGQEGKIGAAEDQKDLGPLPSYAEGLFKVGDRGGNPVVLNPTSAGILQTPAQMAKSLAEIGSGHPGESFTLAQNLTPALATLLALVGASERRHNQSEFGAAKDQLTGGLPILTLLQQLEHPPSGAKKPRIYPRTRRDAVMHFLLGGLAPTPLNKTAAERAKYLEDHPR